MKKEGWIRGGDHPFRILLLIVVLIHIPIFPRHIWFDHDSSNFFQTFFTFYNHFFYHGTLVGWLPYNVWGIPAQLLQITTLSPFIYLAALLSGFAKIRDVLWVLKFSVLIEHIGFLMGAYLFAHRILKHRWAGIFTTLGLVASSTWIYQIYWDFHLYYLLPFVFYFLHRFWEENRPHWLWLAGLSTTCLMLGNLPYFAPLYALIIIFYSAFHFKKIRFSIFFERSWENWGLFSIFLLSAFAYLYMGMHMFDHLLLEVYARDPKTGLSSMETFLTFGGNTNWGKFLGLYLPRAGQIHGHIYGGILTLVFVLYRLITPGKSRTFWAFFAMFIFFSLFSLGEKTPVAKLIYYTFPPIRYFRYIGDAFNFLRLFVVLLAGFGLDQFLGDVTRERNSERLTPQWKLVGCALTVFIIGIGVSTVNVDGQFHPNRWPGFLLFGLLLAFVGAYLMARIVKQKWIGFVGVLFLGIDLLVFHYLFIEAWPKKIYWATDQMVEVSGYQYQPFRTRNPNLSPRMKAAHRLVLARTNLAERNHYLLWDPCIPNQYYGYAVPGVFEYIKENPTIGNSKISRKQTQRHLSIIMPLVGCGLPKLRLISFNVSVPDLKTAKHFVFQDPSMFQRIVFHEPLKSKRVGSNDLLPSNTLGKINVIAFSFNNLVANVHVNDPRGAWLFYPDGYHPGWKAYVDGKQVPIELANLGFKAVALKQGTHRVRFVYFHGIQSVFSYLIAFLGLIFAICVLVMVCWQFFVPVSQQHFPKYP
jgi:hypothetical protein